MTVSTEVSRTIGQGNNVTIVFNYSFPVVGASATDQTNADLWLTDTTGVSTNLADNLWSITGVVTQPTDWASGTFRLSTSTPITTGSTLTMERTQPYTQTTTLSNQGSYSPELVEAALDNLALQTEQLNTWRLQSIRAPIEDVALVDLPSATLRANSFPFFNTSGQLTTASVVGGLPTSITVNSNLTTSLTITGSVTTTASAGTTTVTIGAFRGALVPLLTTQTATSSGTTVVWTTAVYDTDAFWSISHPSRLTVPAGVSKVRLSAHAIINTATSFSGIAMTKNGAGGFQGRGIMAITLGTPSDLYVSAESGVVVVSAADYFEVLAISNTGSLSTASDTTFSIEVVQ